MEFNDECKKNGAIVLLFATPELSSLLMQKKIEHGRVL